MFDLKAISAAVSTAVSTTEHKSVTQLLLERDINELSTNELSELCCELNRQYRKGTPLVTDDVFDSVYMAELNKRAPDHELFSTPQPTCPAELIKDGIKHPSPMLSTQKFYTTEEVERWLTRIKKVATTLGIKNFSIKVTAKLDGIAGRLSNGKLATRGDGIIGTDISKMIDHGLVIHSKNPQAIGEIVIPNAYFEQHLSHEFSHPRNVVAGFAGADNLSDIAIDTFKNSAVHFVSFSEMNSYVVDAESLVSNLSTLIDTIRDESIYPLDGTVIEVVDERIKKSMGSSSHHHHWQAAFKVKGDTAEVYVKNVAWSVGKSGRCSPVVHIEPTKLSGAVISKVTGHHAANIINQQIGVGSILEIVRSGEIIPTILKCKKSSHLTEVPSHCPSCNTELAWKSSPTTKQPTFLVCENDDCDSRLESKIIHFFSTLNVDLFGEKTVSKLVANGINSIEKILACDIHDFVESGLGAGQANNLVNELSKLKLNEHQDVKILAAIGISKLGKRASEKLLTVHQLADICDVTSSEIMCIDGFGVKTAKSIEAALKAQEPLISHLISHLNYTNTSDLLPTQNTNATLKGINIVFTGKMTGNRSDMQKDAVAKGANVQSAVSRRTNVLVTGDNVGQTKINKALELGITIISESEYWHST